MSRNPVQFQRGYSLSAFFDEYGTEAQCEEALFRWRWPNGFICPECGWHGYSALNCRRLFQCHRCHRQTSLTSGTVLASTKLPLWTWFLAMYLLTQTKNGISALELHRQLGVSYNTAWGMKHKLVQAMKERDDTQPLRGQLQVDDAYWGGERRGGKVGRGAPAKTPFVAAVETDKDGRPRKMRLTRVAGFRREAIAEWASRHVQSGSVVTSDGLACFNGIVDAGCKHWYVVTGGGPNSAKTTELHWVNTLLGNVKRSIHGTYHAISPKHLPRYLAEFSYRFNRRFKLVEMLPRLAYIALRTPPMPYRLLTMAEVYG
ncbi:MAG: IS1595 family transposase [Gammaproteobacteria bacterium]|nr:IS1595 family transposase [Gammaproteobacteria bacterium]MDJ0872284.1 IS1595 family transposase [Gammaproteobacteria bacterium]MDJ0891529.1 IS1595 family transposase [Gammaproteobacteria bacterium]